MKLYLSKIAEGPSRHHLCLRVAALPRLAEVAAADGPETGEVSADLDVRMLAGAVEVRGALRVAMKVPCTMCLEPAEVRLEEPVAVVQAPVSMLNDLPDDLQLSQSDLNIDYFEGDEIDLVALTEEQVLLMLPEVVYCREDCQGICAGCKRNLNESECVCVPDNSDHPFAAMKSLLDDPPGRS